MGIRIVILLVLAFNVTNAQHYSWSHVFGSGGQDRGHAIEVDNNQNVLIGGSFSNNVDFDPSNSGANINSGLLSEAAYIAKYDSAGSFLWAFRMGGVSVNSIITDDLNNVYSIGVFHSTSDFNPSINTFNLTAQGGWNTFILKLDSNGSFIWAKSLGGTSQVAPKSIKLDAASNIYVSGLFYGTADLDPGNGTASITAKSDADIYLLKLNANGNYLWSITLGSSQQDHVAELAVDQFGNSYISGILPDSIDFDPSSANYKLHSHMGPTSFIAKYDKQGNLNWAKQFSNDSNYARSFLTSMCLDDQQNVLLVGGFSGAVDFDPGPNQYFLSTPATKGSFISKLDSNGSFIWAKGVFGNSFRENEKVICDQVGNVYISASFKGLVDINPGVNNQPITAIDGYDVFLLSLDQSGNYRWSGRYGGNDDEFINAFAIDPFGGFYTTGNFKGNMNFNPFNGTSNRHSSGNNDLFVSKLQLNYLTNVKAVSRHQAISIFPNPTKDVVQVELPELKKGLALELRNLQGQVVYHELLKAKSTSIEVENLPSGIYLLRYGRHQKKLVVQR